MRNKLWEARDGFAAVVDQTSSQEARGYLAETVNELLCGHLTDGNYLLIEALKARYPFMDTTTELETNRPAGDTWALEANGSIDKEVEEIDKALIEFGIGIKSATRLLDREDVVYDGYTGQGILRTRYLGTDGFAGFPAFAPLHNAFRDPNNSFSPRPPTATPSTSSIPICRRPMPPSRGSRPGTITKSPTTMPMTAPTRRAIPRSS